MAFKRKRTTTVRRRSTAARTTTRRGGRYTAIPSVRALALRTSTVLPRVLETKFRFITRLNVEYIGSTGFSSILNILANSLFDPLGTSGTAQPPFFDQMMSFYQRYQVMNCTMNITATNTSEIPIIIYSVPVTDLTDTYTQATGSVMPNSKYVVLGSLNGSNSVVKLRLSNSTKQVIGVADATLLQGTALTNPTTLWYYHISSAPMLAGLTSDYLATLHIELIYTCILSNIQVVANS